MHLPYANAKHVYIYGHISPFIQPRSEILSPPFSDEKPRASSQHLKYLPRVSELDGCGGGRKGTSFLWIQDPCRPAGSTA